MLSRLRTHHSAITFDLGRSGIRAYQLQSHGHDTVDANRLLGLPDDARDYAAAAAMLRELGVPSIRLMTNNPLKVQALRELGVDIESRVAAFVGANPFSAAYLEAKRDRMGHAIPEIDVGPPPSSRRGLAIGGGNALGDAE